VVGPDHVCDGSLALEELHPRDLDDGVIRDRGHDIVDIALVDAACLAVRPGRHGEGRPRVLEGDGVVMGLEVPVEPVEDVLVLPGIGEKEVPPAVVLDAQLVMVRGVPVAGCLLVEGDEREPVGVLGPAAPEGLVDRACIQVARPGRVLHGDGPVIAVHEVEDLSGGDAARDGGIGEEGGGLDSTDIFHYLGPSVRIEEIVDRIVIVILHISLGDEVVGIEIRHRLPQLGGESAFRGRIDIEDVLAGVMAVHLAPPVEIGQSILLVPTVQVLPGALVKPVTEQRTAAGVVEQVVHEEVVGPHLVPVGRGRGEREVVGVRVVREDNPDNPEVRVGPALKVVE